MIGMSENDGVQFPDGLATEKITREMLIEVGLQANENGLAWFAVDQMFEDARKQLRRGEYDRELITEEYLENSPSQDTGGDR